MHVCSRHVENRVRTSTKVKKKAATCIYFGPGKFPGVWLLGAYCPIVRVYCYGRCSSGLRSTFIRLLSYHDGSPAPKGFNALSR